MKMKLFCSLKLYCLSFFILLTSLAHAEGKVAQTLSITTHFKSIVGNPVWLLELRDAESGQVLPYIFDIKNQNNFWMAFSKERSYRVKASVLKFGSYVRVNNFCYLEDGVLTGKSMYISLTGTIAPGLKRTRCHVIKFNQPEFSIAKPDQPDQ
jgi:hypothetical protein